jgi:gliding motility-associated-like protein
MDIASACSNILATAPYCIETNSLILDAPYGFQSYTWYNADFTAVIGTGQSFTLSPPPVTSGMFYVDVIPYPGFGCRDTLQAIVTPLPVPDTPAVSSVVNYCQFEPATPLTGRALPGHQLLWYTTAEGGTGSSTAPMPSTATVGTYKYYVSQKALFGCEGFRKEITVHVFQTPVASFTVDLSRQCQNGNSFVFASTSTNLKSPGYTWRFGDGESRSSADSFAVYSYTAPGNFAVTLQATNGNTCSAEHTQYVTVVPKPVASFTSPSLLCEQQSQVVLTDHSSVPDGLSSIQNWWWNINGRIVQGQTPPSFTAPAAGTYFVKLVVSTADGCRSDTSTTTLKVRHTPQAAFSIGNRLCNNETIRFTDQSFMPAGGNAETIAKWHWTFDGSASLNAQNPSTYFSAGTHKARLIAETGAGCQSLPLERSFEVYPKPRIDLVINDSCVSVPITFAANDLANNVVKWDWNFGNGFKAGTASYTTTYHSEGSRPFILITQTDKECRDTIYRPFTVFDNKSFAGKDTVAAVNEPVHLDARGEPNMRYAWSPQTGLDQPTIEKPVATLDRDQLYQLYTVTEKGCKKQSQILIKRFAGPELYVPNAFTPNNDGLNDLLRVTPIGIQSFGYLAIYDRWGQLMYRTTNYRTGWDGTFRGAKMPTGTFVYLVQAIDYRGKPLVRKGTVTLLR